MPQVVTAIDIAASPDRIWEVLSNTARYAEWNPLISDFRGELEPGKKIKARIRVDERTFGFDAKLTRVERNAALSWLGPALGPLRYLASGEHFFEIKDIGGGKSRLFHGETFGGFLFDIETIWAKVGPEVERLYEAFNEAIKARVEAA